MKATDKVINDISNPKFIRLKKEDRIKYKFGLGHGKGKRKKKK